MARAPKKVYAKSWMSFSDQLQKLESRGLRVPDRTAAADFLSHINYYRFTGYCLAFQIGGEQFKTGVEFDDVRYACEFDSALRSLVGDWLQLAELDLRTQTCHFITERYDGFGHCDAANFSQRFSRRVTHAQWLARLQKDTKQSDKERFVKHFEQTYSQYPDLPLWTAAEIMTFGSLTRLIGGMKKTDRQTLAQIYGLDQKAFASASLHLSYVRNVCAHHSRLWERLHQIKPVLPSEPHWQAPYLTDNGRLFCTLLLLRKITLRSPTAKKASDRFRDKVAKLLKSPPKVADPDTRMGLPIDWKNHPVWK